MPVKETAKESKVTTPRTTKRWPVICIVLLTVLAVAVTGLTVDKVLSTQAHQRTSQSQMAENQQLRASVSQAESQRDAVQSDLDKAGKTIDKQKSQLSSASSQIASQSKKIKKQNKTIKSMKTRISLNDAGKKTVVTRNQDLPDRDYPNLKGKKLVALTFDDGPGKYTERLLNELKKRDAKATFFVQGQYVDKYPKLIRRMEAEGHVVGSHSYSHKDLTKLSASGIEKDMEKTANKIKKLIGHKPEVMRCPYGSCNSRVKKYAKDAGIPIIFWGVDTRDWESRNVKKILNVSFGKNGIKNGSIVLLHDIHKPTVDASIQMMDRLIDEGYTLVTVPELLMAREGKIRPGVVYS